MVTTAARLQTGLRIRPIINIAALVLVLVVNYLANALPLNGQTTAAVSDQFPVFFVPAGYVFSIWGVIYLALIGFAVYQALPAQQNNIAVERIGYLFALTCLVNSAWMFLWHYEQFPLTLIAMVTLLVLLVAIYIRLDATRANATTAERWLVYLPFSIYLGWITVATVANATDLLYYLGWNGWGIAPETWTAIMLITATVIGAAVSIPRRDIALPLVLLWAFIGIIVKHQDTPAVAFWASIASGLVALVILAALVLGRRDAERQLP